MKAIVCDVRRALAGRWFWAALLATAAAGLLGLILYAVRGGGILLEINAEFNAALLRRMRCGGIWASVGCVMALATETSSAAHLGPLCLCYALMMLGKRFFPAAVMPFDEGGRRIGRSHTLCVVKNHSGLRPYDSARTAQGVGKNYC